MRPEHNNNILGSKSSFRSSREGTGNPARESRPRDDGAKPGTSGKLGHIGKGLSVQSSHKKETRISSSKDLKLVTSTLAPVKKINSSGRNERIRTSRFDPPSAISASSSNQPLTSRASSAEILAVAKEVKRKFSDFQDRHRDEMCDDKKTVIKRSRR